MKHRCLYVAAAALLAAGVLSGCRNGGAAPVGKPAVAVEAYTLAPAERVDAIDVTGTLTAKFEAAVRAEYSAVVRDVYVAEWVKVRKGQALARLDLREPETQALRAKAAAASAKAALLEAEARARQAEREGARMEQLKANGLATQQALDDAKTAREAAAAALEAARGQLRAAEEDARYADTRLDKATIRAPIDGAVALRTCNPGDLVGEPGAGTPMFRVVDNSRLDLTVEVPAARFADLQEGAPLEFSVDAFPGRAFQGRISHVNPAIDEASRTVKVLAAVDNADDQLRAGMFARGRIVVGRRAGVLQAPRASFLSWDVANGAGSVYVIDGGKARLREVKTGRPQGDYVEIVSGLKAGESVVARGAFNVRDGDELKVVPAAGE
ncbi:efflux RND transporter periplasmic adaptor subunit [bacterium]|nr:efflux RND transporter periplasmic adaptor subunit [bacterium]